MRRLLVAGVLLLGMQGGSSAQQLPPATSSGAAPGVHLDLTLEQTKLIVDVLGQAQFGPLTVSSMAMAQRVTELLGAIREQAKAQAK